jgi:hypothetical protein
MENSPPWSWGEQPDPAKLEEFQRKMTQQQTANDNEIKRVLGDAKFREYQEYQSLSGVRWEADRVRTALANAGVPLDESLTKPLLKTLQDQQQKRQREALARVLTPEQLKVIEEEHSSELQMQRAQIRMMRAQQEAGLLDPAQDNGVGFVQSEAVTFKPAASD